MDMSAMHDTNVLCIISMSITCMMHMYSKEVR